MADSDKRTEARHLACMLAQIERQKSDPRNALIRDISTSGALLLTRSKLAVGESVKLSLYLSTEEGAQPVVAEGKVVRVEQRPRDQADMWTHSAAVHFDTALGHLAQELGQIAAKQRSIFGID
jgi:hypothetical protein